MMTVRDTSHEGWGMKDIVQGSKNPSPSKYGAMKAMPTLL